MLWCCKTFTKNTSRVKSSFWNVTIFVVRDERVRSLMLFLFSTFYYTLTRNLSCGKRRLCEEIKFLLILPWVYTRNITPDQRIEIVFRIPTTAERFSAWGMCVQKKLYINVYNMYYIESQFSGYGPPPDSCQTYVMGRLKGWPLWQMSYMKIIKLPLSGIVCYGVRERLLLKHRYCMGEWYSALFCTIWSTETSEKKHQWWRGNMNHLNP